ncbi:MAG: hypothetical protein ACRD2L_13370 [Terriglobia bacterium]
MVTRAAEGNNGTYLASLDSNQSRRLLADESNAEYVRPSSEERQGYLFFVRGNALFAQPFDPERLQTMGEVILLAEQTSGGFIPGYFGFSISRNGVLTYVTGSLRLTSELLWFNRQGKRIGTVGKPSTYSSLSWSTGKRG